MLDQNIKTQLKAYLERLESPIELVAALDESDKAAQIKELVTEIAELSDKVTARFDGNNTRRPSFGVAKAGEQPRVFFAGLPMGHEFTSLILALLQVSGYAPKVSNEVLNQIKGLNLKANFDVFVSLSCHNCPDVVQALNLIAIYNPNTTATMIDGAFFQDEVEQRKIMAVPMVFQDNEHIGQGRMTLEEIVAKLDTNSAEKDAAALNAKDAFDVLVIGGGPAGATAAIYAARKGINTGIVAERFGGQVMDTMDIENFTSVQKTQGPKFAAEMEAHVREYDVDIMNLQRVSKITGADQTANGLVEVELENGAKLESKTVILSTGARWREMNVPGEAEYRTRGVAYCPHCDGPLFKGKRVAVIGGGNSGVEAAIDLAGIVEHVTLVEFDTKLRADQVLQNKLHSLPNTTVIMNALSTEVLGDGSQVTGLKYKDRATDEEHVVELAGIFVQIGLLPNTDFLKDSEVELTNRGEIIVNDRNETNVKGVFAAGDCTTVPYKQIIIATGEGAKASLSAFDYIIRSGQ
ncbi:alkyl hydroperoxide reductase subunit F [Acinetobacter baumannii]|uniref:alkyl hydroperoxide reductase subunit F n=4 Tax=Acinetobacter baumannii TaxID=470 RepID=UPI000DE74C21|nr:alkyl hydroperoxide reductase subunit F [Acinetobacter baumannii]MDA3319393.1 alkyl hydroperoxide reductase subunit F [Acinetobacter baumannii]MDA3472796.1 alkyl hydroperoxide reductase subunit F [Acinetobacter baumannii]MDA3576178.1 alkyl hydroperoxide reductase subunit F [Acinetobacter baumannii]MDA3606386.1 alkyl hydroperoxide reductase subunit F [Acinetobacter baumannii]MDK2222085.1 alkyl hydroperoxide reductase subunit F [Acinetobacter baumannii]